MKFFSLICCSLSLCDPLRLIISEEDSSPAKLYNTILISCAASSFPPPLSQPTSSSDYCVPPRVYD